MTTENKKSIGLKIVSELKTIEQKEQIDILYAVESGSRAWGFASQDSDYDVRFFYVHPIEHYLSINEEQDFIDRPIIDDLDINGWDIRKALGLFRKSNLALLEWLHSPVVYLEKHHTIEKMRRLTATYFSAKTALYHYVHMADKSFQAILMADKASIKKYFYALRPILACSWIEQNKNMPPVPVAKLCKSQMTDKKIMAEIELLLQKKQMGEEKDFIDRVPLLDNFLEDRIPYYKDYVASLVKEQTSEIVPLNELFRETVNSIR